jgi:hypothetical protein
MKNKIKNLNTDVIKEFYKKSLKLEEYIETSNYINGECTEGSKERKVKVLDDKTKKEVEVREFDLWQECLYLGWKAGKRADKYLSKKYPELWERLKRQEELSIEYKKFQIDNFGFELQSMHPRNLLMFILMVTKFTQNLTEEQINDIFKIEKQ